MQQYVIIIIIIGVIGLIIFSTKDKRRDKKLYNEKTISNKNWAKILYYCYNTATPGSGYSYLKLNDGKTFAIGGQAFSSLLKIKQIAAGNISGTYQRTYKSTTTPFAELKVDNQTYHFMINENKTEMSVKIKDQEYKAILLEGDRLSDKILKNGTPIAQINKITDHYTEVIFNDDQNDSESVLILSFLSMSERLY